MSWADDNLDYGFDDEDFMRFKLNAHYDDVDHDKYWVTQHGDVLEISEMTTDHLYNIIQACKNPKQAILDEYAKRIGFTKN
jgi:hypothetical protein